MILIPARNEGPRIGLVIRSVQVAQPGVEIVVIANDCTDDTALVAVQAGATVIESARGYGQALCAGYRYAVGQPGVAWVVQLDADGQHPPDAIPRLLEGLGRADVVIGSRFASGGSAESWPRRRRWTVQLMGMATEWMSGLQVQDISSGFQALNISVVAAIVNDFPVELTDANLLVRIQRMGFSVTEVGVKMACRAGGESMHGGFRSAIYAGKTLMAVSREIRR